MDFQYIFKQIWWWFTKQINSLKTNNYILLLTTISDVVRFEWALGH